MLSTNHGQQVSVSTRKAELQSSTNRGEPRVFLYQLLVHKSLCTRTSVVQTILLFKHYHHDIHRMDITGSTTARTKPRRPNEADWTWLRPVIEQEYKKEGKTRQQVCASLLALYGIEIT